MESLQTCKEDLRDINVKGTNVQEYKKGVTMAKILWSVDEKKYNDKNAHTLILTGWAASTEKKPCSFILQGNGNVNENISIPEPFRFDRADVAGNFPELAGITDAGFTVEIPQVLDLAGEYGNLEVFVTDGEEQEKIWGASAEEIRNFCADCLMEYRIDREQILGKSTLMVDGWVLDSERYR